MSHNVTLFQIFGTKLRVPFMFGLGSERLYFFVSINKAKTKHIAGLAAWKIGDYAIISDMKFGPQRHLGAESQSEGTIHLVSKSIEMVMIFSQRRGGTWEGVTVAIWCGEWICKMREGLVHHTIINPAALSLPLLRGACSRSCTHNICTHKFFHPQHWLVCTRISNFSNLQKCPLPECTSAFLKQLDVVLKSY